MKKIILSLVLIQSIFSGLDARNVTSKEIKKHLQEIIHLHLVYQPCYDSYSNHQYHVGKTHAFYDILEMIERYEAIDSNGRERG